ncbi:hypothetical protein SUGI_0916430 [Cryptomeria japonica]|nr:hypothetical protein SUGI_0916430 [Cryptomeria japonica]
MSDEKKMKIEELRVVKVLGRGAMGTVLLVVQEACKDHPFALKLISKDSKDQQFLRKSRGIEREREILSSLHHPFLPSLMGEIETHNMVGWAIEYCPGGDLHFLRQMQPDRTFSESAIRFYAAEVVLALEHLHSKGIVYRDLKPENILLQRTGHIMLTDFDLSKRLQPQPNESKSSLNQDHQHSSEQTRGWKVFSKNLTSKPKKSQFPQASTQNSTGPLRSNSFVGTDEYVAPEVVTGEGHGFSVDWWSLGIFLYELLYGRTPFKGLTSKETFTRILLMSPKLMGPSTPLHSLILRLLEKNPQKRMGFCNGASEVKSHEFFTGLQWDSIHQLCRPPVVPDLDKTLNHILTSELQDLLSVSTSEEEEETSDSELDGHF